MEPEHVSAGAAVLSLAAIIWIAFKEQRDRRESRLNTRFDNLEKMIKGNEKTNQQEHGELRADVGNVAKDVAYIRGWVEASSQRERNATTSNSGGVTA